MELIKCIQVYEAISNPYSGHIILVSSLKDNFGKIKGEILYLLFLSFHHDLWGTIHIIFPQRRKLLSHRQAGKPPVYPVETGDFSDCQKYREEISEGAAVSNTREMLLAMSDFSGRRCSSCILCPHGPYWLTSTSASHPSSRRRRSARSNPEVAQVTFAYIFISKISSCGQMQGKLGEH